MQPVKPLFTTSNAPACQDIQEMEKLLAIEFHRMQLSLFLLGALEMMIAQTLLHVEIKLA
jgi:hypothetical protein